MAPNKSNPLNLMIFLFSMISCGRIKGPLYEFTAFVLNTTRNYLESIMFAEEFWEGTKKS